jgi:hypothetical protein
MSSCSGGGNETKQLEVIKILAIEGCIHYSNKVRNNIENGYYTVNDLIACILSANLLHKVEEDDLSTAIDGKKYTILGKDTSKNPFYTCGKIIMGEGGCRLYFFITAHEATSHEHK